MIKRILLLLLLISSAAVAQNYNMGNSNISTCSGNFYDSGGAGGNYGNNETRTMTFCSSTSGQCVRATFTQFDLENGWDFLEIYNGPTAAGTPIATLTGTTIPGPITCTSGCLTFVFTSDFTVNRAGWAATLSCVPCPGSNCPACAGGPPPANDACSGAQNLGSLPTPAVCVGTTGGLGAWANFNLTNTCATAEVPYTSLPNCQPSGNNQADPAADVWYRFTATGQALNVQLQGLQNPNIALYSGTSCNTMIPRGCATGSNYSLNTTFTSLTAGQQYYLQVSGGNLTDQCAFTLALQNNMDCDGCLTGSTLTVNPPPVNGTYQAGQLVNFCLTVTDFLHTSSNWLHGVVPTFGAGWDMSTLTPGAPPPKCVVGTLGYWQWYNTPITSSANGAINGPGFFYNSNQGGPTPPYPDTNPGNNYGDPGDPNCDWVFCWSIRTKPQAQCVDGADLGVTVNTLGDGESGGWTSVACTVDPDQNFLSTLTCCLPPIITVTNPNCAGNNGSAVGSGQGNAPWDYTWKNAAGTVLQQANNVNGTNTMNNLPAGNYSLTTNDNANCSATSFFTITAPPAIIPATVITNTNCGQANGTITINATGGTTPYQYSINNGVNYQASNVFTNLSGGNYTIVVRDSHNCIASIVMPLATSAGPAINTTPAVATTCNGGSNGTITVNASGGVAPLQYSSNGGTTFQAGNALTGLASGNYTVVVRDANGCTSSVVVNVGQPPPIIISNVATVSASCGTSNGSLTITAAGGTGALQYSANNGVSYQASNIFNGLAAGNYDVVVRDANGCTVIASPVINNTSAPVINNINSVNVICNGGNNGSISITASGGTAPLTYSINNGVSFQNPVLFSNLTAGSYDIVVRDAVGCAVNMNIIITAPPAIVINPVANGSTCNAANGSIQFNSTGGTAPLQYSINNGATYQAGNNFTNLLSGNYNVIVRDINNCTSAAVVNVPSAPGPAINTAPKTNVTCNGGTNGLITVNATGGLAPLQYSNDNGVTYQAGNVFNNLAAANYQVVVRDANGCTAALAVNITQPTPVSGNANSTPTTCSNSNGTITLNASGGTGPYTYSINGGTTFQASGSFTNLAASGYGIVVRDANGCLDNINLNLLDEPGPRLDSVVAVPVSCAGPNTGSLSLYADGGTAPLQYSINNGANYQAGNIFNGLAAGNYNIVVRDANGCTISTPYIIPGAPVLAIASTPKVDVTCNGASTGSITINANGGTAPLQYSINNGANYQAGNAFNSLPAGNYQIVVRDANGCTQSTAVTIIQPTVVAINSTPTVDVTCNGGSTGSITINANGGTAPLQYSISNGANYQAGSVFNNLAAGNYQIIVRDANGCTHSTTANIIQPTAVAINSTPKVDLTCNGVSTGSITINANGGTAPLQYSINNGGNYQAGSAFNSLPAGNYQIVVRDANGCTQTTTASIIQPTAVAINSTPKVDVTCNGASTGSITINANGGTAPLQYSINNGANYQAGNAFNNLAAGNYQIVVRDANGCTQTTAVNIIQPTVVVIASAPVVNVTCNGGSTGSITINANGGTAPLQYSINNGTNYQAGNTFNNLAAGNYQIVVRDANGCTQSTTASIIQPTAVAINSTPKVDVTCNGASTGSITINANGGTAPLQYSINNGTNYQAGNTFNNLAAGNYQIVVRDANGCTQTTTASIIQPTAVAINSTPTVDVTCNGASTGSITINANGGTAPLQYSINNGANYQAGNAFNSLPAGNYQIVVRDANGCTQSTAVTIIQPTVVAINSTPTVDVTCNGGSTGSITINANGGTAPLQYSISNGANYQAGSVFNNLAAGNYQIIVRDANGCTQSTAVNIIQPTAVVIASAPVIDEACNGALTGSITINANGGTAPLQYSINNGTNYQAGNTFNNLAAGNYQIVVRDANGCTQSTTASIIQPTAVAINSTPKVDVTCNGASTGSITINANGGTAPLQYSINNGANYQAGSVFNNLAAGNYQIVVRDANGCTQSTAVTIIQPTAVVIASAPVVNVTCNGGSTGGITINANGGTAPLQYSIDNGTTFQAANIFNGLSANNYQIVVQDANGCTQSTTANIIQPAAVVIASAPVVDVTCNGASTGSITINANGGAAPLQYSITNGATYQAGNTFNNLAAGNYQIVVRDANGCTQSTTASIIQPTAVAINSTPKVDVTCNGASTGSITINANGGTAPLQYSINNGANYQAGNAFNNLAAGNYQIVVRDANGCTQSTAVNIIQPTAVVIASAPVVNVTCNGASTGSITINANGGTTPLQYSIDNGTTLQAGNVFNNLPVGNYQIIVEDGNGCTQSTAANIIQPAAINFNTVITDANCGNNNGAITINANGGTAPLQYSINNGTTYQAGSVFNSLVANNYSIIVRDANGCTATANAAVSNLAAPAITNLTSTDVSCNGGNNGTITIAGSGGTGALQYSINNGSTFQAGGIYNNLPAGNYSIVVRDAAGCQVTSSIIIAQPAPIVLNFSLTQPSCGLANGQISVIPVGGTPGYQYSYNNGSTFQAGSVLVSVGSGNYQIVVKDVNGCTASLVTNLSSPQTPMIGTTPVVNSTCNGADNGSITINMLAGILPMQYSIDNGVTYQAGSVFNNLSPGNYTIVVMDTNGCTRTTNVQVTEPNGIAGNANTVSSTCGNNDGSLTVVANGGTGALQYSINNGTTYQASATFNNLLAGNYTVVVRDANGCTQTIPVSVNNLSAPSIASANGTDATCNGVNNGSIVITAGGGTGALQYSINNGTTFQAGNTFNNLAPGNYNIVVKDANNCNATTVVVIVQPTAIAGATNVTGTTCSNANGSIVVNANGGTGALQYSINNGTTYQASTTFNNLASGNYTVIIRDANGCTVSVPANLINAPSPAIAATPVVNSTCFGSDNGTITINANGGTAPLQYSINNGATYQPGNLFNNLSPANYAIVVQDANGCTVTSNAQVTEPNIIAGNANTVASTCGNSDGSFTVVANGGTGVLQYSINNGTTYQASATFNNLIAGNYSVVIKDANGCTQTIAVAVSNQTAPSIASANGTDATCNGVNNGSIVITAAGGTGLLQYSINNGNTFQAGNTFSNLAPGNYNIVVKDANNCNATTTLTINQPTAIAGATNVTGTTCSNANGSIVVNANGGTGALQYSINNGTTYQASTTFNNLASGNYTIIIRDANGCTSSVPAVLNDAPSPTIAATPVVNSTCFGSDDGTITINVNGGTAPLQYSINNGTTYQPGNLFSSLSPANYAIVVQDANGCTVTSNAQVTEPNIIAGNANTVASTCGNSDGSFTVVANGGTGALQYSINGGTTYQASATFNNLLAGNYSVVIKDANGCTQTIPVAVSNQAAPSIASANGTDITCNGANNGIIVINAGGGTGALQYSINNGTTFQAGNTFNNLAPGNYNIVVKDANNCNATTTVLLVQPTAIAGATNVTGTTCSNANGNIVVNANGGTGALQYSINNGTTYQASATFNNLSAGNYTVIIQDANGCTASVPAVLNDAPSPTINNAAVVNSTCFGANDASVTVTAINGTAPLQYSINNGTTYQAGNIFNNLAPGNYPVIVQDANGCTATTNAPVGQPTAIAINTNTVSSTCGNNDGSITVNANGGTGALQYSINNGTTYQSSVLFNALAAGNYTITVRDANGCTQTAPVVVANQAAPAIASAPVVDLTCNGSANGSITVNAAGGTGALQYSINNGITFQAGNVFNNLTAGNYSVVVEDANGCNAALPVVVAQPLVLVANAVASGTTCSAANGSVTVNASGGTGAFTYSINNGTTYQASATFNSLPAGNYTVIVRDVNGCTAQAPFSVIDAPAPLLLNNPVQNITCNGLTNGSITINTSGGTAPVNYSINGGTSYQSANIYNNLPAGNYAIVVQDANGCTVTSNAAVIQPAAIVANGNPVNANCNQADGSITIAANGGTGVLQYSIDNGVSFQLSSSFNFLNAGNYTVIVQDANGCTVNVPVVVNNNSAPAIAAANVTHITCNGLNNGAINVNANGGTAPLQYSVNNGVSYQPAFAFNNLAPGNYSVIVQDATGCTATAAAVVNQPALLVMNAASVGSTCGLNNGSLQLNANGGTGVYQYSNNNGTAWQASSQFANLSSGPYQLVVQDANGCTASFNGNVLSAPSPIINNVGTANSTCNGSNNGSIVIATNGGTAPLQYSINNGTTFQPGNTFINLAAANYAVLVQDANGCTVSSNAVIAEPNAVNGVINTVNANCNQADGSLTVNANGGTGVLQYSIDNGASFQSSPTFGFLTAGNYAVIIEDANGCQLLLNTAVANNSAPVIASVTPVDVTCNGLNNGSITIAANNGTSPLQYSINNGATFQALPQFNNVSPGNYAVVVQDASGCTVTDVAVIIQPAALAMASQTTIATCGNNNGSITINANGGTAPLQYSINNGATFQASSAFLNIAPNNYQVVVSDANGCQLTGNAAVSSSPSPTLNNIAPGNVTCNGAADGTISVSASGGTAPLQYSINGGTTYQSSNTFNNLANNTYAVWVKDANGCTVAGNANIVQPAPVNVATVNTAANCGNADGSLTINANGGSGTLQYSINGGTSYQSGSVFNNLSAGNYAVVVQDANGCTSSLNAPVASASAPVISNLNVAHATCNGSANGSIQITVSGGALPYIYSINGGITSQAGSLFSNLAAGNYNVLVTDDNGCTVTANNTLLNQPSGINVVINTLPANCGNNDGSITVVANGGAGVLQYSINNGTTYQANGNFANVGAGNYSVVVRDGNGCTVLNNAAVNNNNAPIISAALHTDVSCSGGNNGTINVSANGGTGVLQYSIDNGVTWQLASSFSSLPANNYSVSVQDANGCLANTGVIIIQPQPLLFNGVPVSSTCGSNNGSLTINTIGGTLPYQYSIDNGATYQAGSAFNNLGANNYAVIVQDDNGCTASGNVAVANLAGPLISNINPTDATCYNLNNGIIVITANGGTGVLQYSINSGSTWQSGNIFNNLSPSNYNILIQDANGCMVGSNAIIAQPTSVAFNTNTTTATCNAANGSIIFNANGGTSPYQYSIDNGITYQSSANFANISGGNYNAVVSDNNGCSIAAIVPVNNAAGASITQVVPQDVTCFGAGDGSIAITTTGGTNPLQYSINNGTTYQAASTFNLLSPGNYSVIVQDANGCTATSAASIVQPQQINYIVNTTTVTCGSSNGTLTISGVTGGNNVYQYSINNGTTFQAGGAFNNLPAANYNVFVQDGNGCGAASVVAVVDASAPSIVSLVSTDALCNGGATGSLTVTPVGSGPFTYSINNGVSYQPGSTFNNLLAGNYTVIVKDVNGCTASSIDSVVDPSILLLNITVAGSTCSNSNGSIQLSGNGGTGTYIYSTNNGITYQSSGNFASLDSGNYTVIVKDINGCTSSQNINLTDAPSPVISSSVANDVTCFGAADGSVQINTTGGTNPLQYSIDNGATYQSSSVFNNLQNGNYSIVVTDSNGCTATDNALLLQPAQVNYTVAVVSSTCGNANGSIAVNNVTGGNGIYNFSSDSGSTYQSSSQFNGVSTGTYYIVVEDGNGCSQNAVAIVNDLSGPSIGSLVLNDVLCYNDASGNIQVSPSGGTGPFQYSTDNGASFQGGNYFNNVTAGVYIVVIADANGCTVDSAITINQPTQITYTVTTSIATCGNANGTLSFNANGGTGAYQYSINNGITYQSSSSFNNLTPGNYSVVVMDNNNCQLSGTDSILSAPAPVLSLSNSIDITCFGLSNGSITLNTISGTSPLQFGIDNGSGVVWQSSSSFNNLTAGNYTITVVDSNGCADSLTEILSQPQSILLQPAASKAQCNGSSDGSVSVIVNGGVAPFTYLWITSDTSQTVSNLPAGNYQVTVTDSNNCSENTTAVINEPAAINDNGIVTDITCNGLTDGSIVLNVTGGSTPYYYQWSGSLVTTSSISNLTAGTYTVTVTDGHNCNFNQTYNIIEPDAINAFLAADSVKCFGGNTGELQVVFVNPGLQPYTYQWNGSASVTNTASNLYAGNYSVTIADNNGCTATLTEIIYEPAELIAAANGTNILCNGMATGAAAVNVNGGTLPYIYQWTGGGTTSSINNLVSGTYYVTVTDGNGCKKNVSTYLSQPAVLSLRVSSDHLICIGQDATLTAAAYGGTPPYNYTWNTGWNSNIYTVNPDSSIVYFVSVTDNNGCVVDSQQIAVNVNPPLDVVVSIGDTICKGETTTVTCLASGGNGGPYTYTWSNNPAGTPQITVTPDSTTIYSVSISDGCTVAPANSSTTVQVNELPNTQFTPDPGEGCVPLTVSFVNASNGMKYMWDFGDGTHSVMNNPHHTYTMSGTFDVSLEATASNGCKKILVIPDAVEVFELPIAEFGYSPDHATILNKNIEFSNHSYLGNTYWWDFGDGIGTSSEIHPEYMYADSGTYTVMLVAISSHGCEDTTYGEVIIEGIFSLYVPNSFTPNGDGRNDFFTYYGEGIVSADLQIFNRWGDVIYRDDSNTHAGWKGIADDGKECQQGVYIYLIKAKDANGTEHEVSGTVTLVR